MLNISLSFNATENSLDDHFDFDDWFEKLLNFFWYFQPNKKDSFS